MNFVCKNCIHSASDEKDEEPEQASEKAEDNKSAGTGSESGFDRYSDVESEKVLKAQKKGKQGIISSIFFKDEEKIFGDNAKRQMMFPMTVCKQYHEKLSNFKYI